jgi:hypothetical protein
VADNKFSSGLIQVCVKIFSAVLFGYAFISGYVAFSSILLIKLGMQMGEAVALNGMIAFILYLGIVVWVFATAKVWQTSLIIIFAAIAMILVSPYLSANL